VAAPSHPLRDALEARDVEILRRGLAEDVIVHSPIFSVEFDGVDETCAVMDGVYQALGDIEYLHDEKGEAPGDPHVFAWRSDVDGEPLEGVDIVRYDSEGKINDLTVFFRPLRGIAAFLDKAGPVMAAKQSRGKGLLMRAMGPPPSMMMRSVAGLGPKMLGLKRAGKQGS
jgi:hypothetical protein